MLETGELSVAVVGAVMVICLEVVKLPDGVRLGGLSCVWVIA